VNNKIVLILETEIVMSMLRLECHLNNVVNLLW